MRPIVFIAALLAAAPVIAGATTAPSANWANTGFNAQHTGYNKAERALTKANVSGVHQAWSFPTQGVISAQAVEANGSLFVLSGDNNLYALSASTGQLLWTNPVNNYYATGLAANRSLVFSTCAIQNGGNTNGGVCAIRASNGKLVWRYDIAAVNGGPVNSNAGSAPVLDGNHIILSMADTSNYHSGELVSLDPATGAVQWVIPGCSDHVTDYCGSGGGGTPAVDHGGVFYTFGSSVAGYNAAICRVDEATGAQSWCQTIVENAGVSGQAVAGGQVYAAFGNTDGATATLEALNETTGAVIWSQTVNSWNHEETPAIAGATAYFVVAGSLYAVSTKTGEILWTYAAGGPAGTLAGGVSVANGVVYGECGGAQFCAFNAKTGAILSSFGDRYSVGDLAPTVVNGTVFEACDYNAMCAYVP